jgi:hypothetical protein
MLIEVLRNIFKRDLEKLEQEISAYATDANLWVVENNIANSGGTKKRIAGSDSGNQRDGG